jgi:hypothetical protein
MTTMKVYGTLVVIAIATVLLTAGCVQTTTPSITDIRIGYQQAHIRWLK